MQIQLNIQNILEDDHALIQEIPDICYFEAWSKEVIRKISPLSHLTCENQSDIEQEICLNIRIVDSDESQELNKEYRGKDKSTNVLSFPHERIEGLPFLILGDLVICAPVVHNEAKESKKTTISHWAHLTIHGILHLLGYDHIQEEDAIIMESLEIDLLKQFNIANPYQTT